VSALRAKATTLKRAARRKPAAAKRPASPPAPLARHARVQRVARTPTWRTRRRAEVSSVPSAPAPPAAFLPAAVPAAPSLPATAPAAPTPGPRAPSRSLEEAFAIPAGYGETVLVLMVRDPWWVHAYWEVTGGVERAARSQLQPEEVAGLQSVLRVYDVTETEGAPAARWFDIPLSGLATNWYIHVNAPNRSFVVELGLLTGAGRFLPLVRSNPVTTPRDGPSDVLDEAWSTTEELFAQLVGVAEIGMGASPAGWAARGWRHLFAAQRSSAHLAGVPAGSGLRGLWVRVDTDLVVYGATDPRAKIAIQGQPVAVRKDGTFSLRIALPEGTQHLTIDVTSPDGRQTRTVAPLVTLARPAEEPAPPVGLPVKPAGPSSRG
jgi:hypothetical protein